MSSSTGDNVVARRAAITKSIDGIKEKKHKILDALKTIKESGEPDMVLMGKLVGAFDSLSAQEDNYTKVLVDIANIHEQATVDVAQDFSDAIDKIKNGGIAKEDKNEVDDENDVIEMNQLAKELAEVQAQAVAASMLNEQLVLKMSQQKNKTAALNEYRKSSSDDVNRRAEEALRDVQNAKIRVTGERQENDRKAKQLERLRKKAVERGIQLGKEEEKQKEELVAQAEQSPIRIPVLNRKNEKAGEQPELSEEERRKEIKNKIKLEKERRDNLHSQIRERLAEMDSRRSRMDTIRQMLSQMSSVDKNDAASNGEAPDSAKELDAVDALEVTFQNAQAKLRNLTAMRERLEQIQADGSDLSVDEQAFIDTLGGEETEEGKETPDEQNPLKEELSEDIPMTDDDQEMLAFAVRSNFEKTINSHRFSELRRAATIFTDDCPKIRGCRNREELLTIRTILDSHTQLLEAIDRKMETTRNSPRVNPSKSFSQSSQLKDIFLTASPSSLRQLAQDLIRLSDGESIPDLVSHIDRVLLPSEEVVQSARRELNSTHGRLKKQKTLERVKLLVDGENTNVEQDVERPSSSGLEEIIGEILQQVRPRFLENDDGVLDEDTIQSVRELVVVCASRECATVSRNLFETQLGSIVTHTLAPYIGCSTADVIDTLLFELSDVLYNEIAFFQLINSLNSIPDPIF